MLVKGGREEGGGETVEEVGARGGKELKVSMRRLYQSANDLTASENGYRGRTDLRGM